MLIRFGCDCYCNFESNTWNYYLNKCGWYRRGSTRNSGISNN